jgi:hypothetical protein
MYNVYLRKPVEGFRNGETYPFWSNPFFLHRNKLKTLGDLLKWADAKDNLSDNEDPDYDYDTAQAMKFFASLGPDGKWVLKGNRSSVKTDKIYVYGLSSSSTPDTFMLINNERELTGYRFNPNNTNFNNEFPIIIDLESVYADDAVQTNLPSYLYKKNNYTYAPDPVFRFDQRDKGNQELFFGLELEMSTKLSCRELQKIVTEVEPKQDFFFYFKQDSSISGSYSNLVELVTHPCSPAFLRKNFRILFQKIERLCEERGIFMHDVIDMTPNPSNGIHIHVSRKSFGDTRRPVGKHWKNRFASVWNLWDSESTDFLTVLSRRPSPISDNRFCKAHPNMRGKFVSNRLVTGAVCENRDDRYSACRETTATVEVRIFQGMFDLGHILYCIQLTKAVHEYSSGMSLSALGRGFKQDFTRWVAQSGRYPSIIKEIKKCA